MPPMLAFQLSMLAAGVITSAWQAHGEQKMIQQGRALEKAGIDMNLAANNYEFQESALESMKNLRQNIGTQMVMNAARGSAGGTQGVVGSMQKSISATSGDVEARRMKMLSREAELRASNVLSGLHTLQSETELGRRLSKDVFEAAGTGLTRLEEPMNALAKKFGFGGV